MTTPATGHNRLAANPEDVKQAAQADLHDLKATYETTLTHAAQYTGNDFPVTTDEEMRAIDDLITKVKKAEAEVEAKRVHHSGPHHACHRASQDVFNPETTRLAKVRKALLAQVNDYKVAKRREQDEAKEARRREREERKAAEQAAEAAGQPKPARAKVTPRAPSEPAVTHTRTRTTATITDLTAAAQWVADTFPADFQAFVQGKVDTTLRKNVAVAKAIPGVEVKETQEAY